MLLSQVVKLARLFELQLQQPLLQVLLFEFVAHLEDFEPIRVALVQLLLKLVEYALETPILALNFVPVTFRDLVKSGRPHVVCHSFADRDEFLKWQHLMQLLILLLVVG